MKTNKKSKFEAKKPEIDVKANYSKDLLKYLLLFLVLFLGPQLFLINHYDFANLPQQAFIHIISTLFLAYVVFARVDSEGFRFVWSIYYVPIFGFLLWALISITWAHNKYEGITTILLWVGPVTLFLGIVNARLETEGIFKVLNFIFASGLASAIIGCLQYLTKFPLIPQVIEPAATFANKNMAAHIMVLNIPIGIALLITCRTTFQSFYYAISTSFMILFLYYTKTKAGWLAFCVEGALILTYLFFVRPKVQWARSKQVASLLGIVILGVLMNLSPYGWTPAFKEISQRAELVKEAVEGKDEAEEAAYLSVGLRLAIFRNTLEMIKDRPIWGFGLGNHKVYYPIYHRKAVVEKVFSEEAQLHNVHNDFLQLFSETGIIGIGLLSFLVFLWFRSTKRLALDRRKEDFGVWAAGIFVAIVGIFVNSNFCFPTFRAVPPMIVMAYTALFHSMEMSCGADSPKYLLLKRPTNLILAPALLALTGFLCYYYGKLLVSDRYYLLISRYETKKNWKGILDIAPLGLKLEPDRAKIRSYMGRAYVELGRCKEGAEELNRVLEYYPYHMNALLNLGVAYSCSGEYEKALETYKRVLAIKPDYAKVYNNMAHVYMKMGESKKALESMQEAVKFNPKDPNLMANLGILYLNSGDPKSAVEHLERSISLNPKWHIPYRHLGLAYLQLGQRDQGIGALEMALKLAPNQQGSEEIKRLLEDLKKANTGG